MRTFAVTGFNGHWPVGTSAVVVAEDKDEAHGILGEHLKGIGLSIGDATFVEIDPASRQIIVLQDGNY